MCALHTHRSVRYLCRRVRRVVVVACLCIVSKYYTDESLSPTLIRASTSSMASLSRVSNEQPPRTAEPVLASLLFPLRFNAGPRLAWRCTRSFPSPLHLLPFVVGRGARHSPPSCFPGRILETVALSAVPGTVFQTVGGYRSGGPSKPPRLFPVMQSLL